MPVSCVEMEGELVFWLERLGSGMGDSLVRNSPNIKRVFKGAGQS